MIIDDNYIKREFNQKASLIKKKEYKKAWIMNNNNINQYL